MPPAEKDEQRQRACDQPERQDTIAESHPVATGQSEKEAQKDGSQQSGKPEQDEPTAGGQQVISEAVADKPKKLGKLQLVLVILGMLQASSLSRVLLLLHPPGLDE